MANEIPADTQPDGGPDRSGRSESDAGGAQGGYGSGRDLDRGASFDAQQGGGRSSDDIDDAQNKDDRRDAEQTAEANAYLVDREGSAGVDDKAGS